MSMSIELSSNFYSALRKATCNVYEKFLIEKSQQGSKSAIYALVVAKFYLICSQAWKHMLPEGKFENSLIDSIIVFIDCVLSYSTNSSVSLPVYFEKKCVSSLKSVSYSQHLNVRKNVSLKQVRNKARSSRNNFIKKHGVVPSLNQLFNEAGLPVDEIINFVDKKTFNCSKNSISVLGSKQKVGNIEFPAIAIYEGLMLMEPKIRSLYLFHCGFYSSKEKPLNISGICSVFGLNSRSTFTWLENKAKNIMCNSIKNSIDRTTQKAFPNMNSDNSEKSR